MRSGSARLYLRGRIWWAWGYDAAGRKWVKSTRQRDQRAAEIAARALERRHADPDHAPAQSITIEDALDRLVTNARRLEKSAATIEIHLAKGGHLVRLLGHATEITALTRDDLLSYVAQRRTEGASRHTAAKELWTLRAALRLLKRDGYYSGDPSALMPDGYSGLDGLHTPRARWLTEREIGKLLRELGPDRRDWVLVAIGTGMRRGEMARLERRHVDLRARLLHVPGTKTAAAARTIPLGATALPPLRRRLLRLRDPKALIFGPWRNVGRDLPAACERAGIPACSPNDLRRTFASQAAQRGVPALTAARLLGHTSTRMVERVYARLDLGTLREAVARLPDCSSVVANQGRSQGRPGTPRTKGAAESRRK